MIQAQGPSQLSEMPILGSQTQWSNGWQLWQLEYSSWLVEKTQMGYP